MDKIRDTYMADLEEVKRLSLRDHPSLPIIVGA